MFFGVATQQNNMMKNKTAIEDHNKVQRMVISERRGAGGGGHGGRRGGRHGGGRRGNGRKGTIPILGAARGRPSKAKKHHHHGSACLTAHFQLIMPVFLLAFGFFLM